MAQQLKRWETPRRKGRNDKGRGGAARQRQLAKRTQALRKRLQDGSPNANNQRNHERGEQLLSSFLVVSTAKPQ
jgi:hypothetical protein